MCLAVLLIIIIISVVDEFNIQRDINIRLFKLINYLSQVTKARDDDDLF